MQNLTVTFDSNVWENIIDEKKRINNSLYNTLYKSIVDKKIIPFFFEGIVTTETILKKDRKDYFENYKATTSFQIENEKPIITEGTKSPKLTSYLQENIPKALNLGFKFIKFPRIGGISLNIDEKYILEDKMEMYPTVNNSDDDYGLPVFEIKDNEIYPTVHNKRYSYGLSVFEIRNNEVYPTASNSIDSYGLSVFDIR